MSTQDSSDTSVEHPITFSEIGFSEPILQAITAQGYNVPTPIQAQAIPHVLAGRDVMGAAQTGTGKTAAFVLPILEKILPLANTSSSPARHPVRALVLTPTRELADQVAENVSKYAKFTSIRSAVVFGGVDMTAQVGQLRAGVEFLIATPGRLLDHITQKNTSLGQVSYLVLDEADRMLDMGFLPDLQKIQNLIPKVRQTLLFSATFSPEIKKLAQTYLNNPVVVEVAKQNAAADTVKQVVHKVALEKKQDALVHILKDRARRGLPNQCIVFTNSRLGCSKLATALGRFEIKAAALHGDKSQVERMQVLDDFKQSKVDVLVATDVAARGLDISNMPCVINYELPFNSEDYVHRIGRTGRAGAQGDAIALVDGSEEKQLAEIEALISRKLIRLPVPDPNNPSASDPLFYMPYAPSASGEKSAVTSSTNQTSQSKPAIEPKSPRVGALLGGHKKS